MTRAAAGSQRQRGPGLRCVPPRELSIAAREPALRVGQLLEQSPEGGREEGKCGRVGREEGLDRRRLRRAQRVPGEPPELDLVSPERPPLRPQRLELLRV